MKPCIQLVGVIMASILVLASELWANPSSECRTKLARIFLRNSGIDYDAQEEINRSAQIIYNDIAPKLGLNIPDSVITMMDANDMVATISAHGYPAPHAYDGEQIMKGARQAAGAYEVVMPGQGRDRQFIRTTNSMAETRLVLAHVAGHYDFFGTAPVFRMRDADQMRYSLQLSELMTRLYKEGKKDEVAEFYQWMLSLRFLQDVTRGTFENPENFRLAEKGPNERYEAPGPYDMSEVRRENEPNRHPRSPTRSVLQFFVRNFSDPRNPWKAEMLDLFEKTVRVFPAVMTTKGMNEGWATILEYIILAHSPWSKSSDAVTFGGIQHGTRVPQLSNPYWLFSEAWMRIRERLLERPEIRELSAVEQDNRFVEEAHRLMGQYTDYTFLQMALDEKWISQFDFVLFREATLDDMEDVEGASANGPKNIAVTRDAHRVARKIASLTSNLELHFPKIEVVNDNRETTGTLQLRHVPVLSVPLRKETVSKALYVIARTLQRPISIDTIMIEQALGWSGPWGGPQPKERTVHEVRITATPAGKVSIEPRAEESAAQEKTAGFVNDGQIAKLLQDYVDVYREDCAFSYSDSRNEREQARFLAFQKYDPNDTNGAVLDALPNILTHAPTAAQAVLEYMKLLKVRRDKMLRLAVQGKREARFSADGTKLQIKIMPEIPGFELDREEMKAALGALPPTPVDSRTSFKTDLMFAEPEQLFSVLEEKKTAAQNEEMPDGDLDLGEGPYQPGDMWDRPGGRGRGQPGEGEEGDQNTGPGDKEGEAQYEDVPVELYGELLAEMIEFRNMRETEGGELLRDEDFRTGKERRPSGNILWGPTAVVAYGKGLAIARYLNMDLKKLKPAGILKLGIQNMTNSDHVVSSRDIEPTPNTDVVVVWTADTSGSVTEEHRRIMRQTVANVEALLRSRYRHYQERFIIYDTRAVEVSREEFFKTYLNGGTLGASGFRLAQKLLGEYPLSRYNRYFVGFSDGEDGRTAESIAELEKVAEMTDYAGYVHVTPGDLAELGMGANLSEAAQALSAKKPDRFGFSIVTNQASTIFETIRQLFGKKPAN